MSKLKSFGDSMSESRTAPKATEWEGRATISREVRKDFWKLLKKLKKEEFEKDLKKWGVEEDRNYRKEYDNYHSDPKQIERRSKRNEARRSLKGQKKLTADKDVHHKDNNPMNNDKSNLSIVTQKYNRTEPRLRKEDAPVNATGDAIAMPPTMKKKKKEKTDLRKRWESAITEANDFAGVIFESHGNTHDNGVHEIGTPETRKAYQEDTPGQQVDEYISIQTRFFQEQKDKVKKHFSQVIGNPLEGYPYNEEIEVKKGH